MAEPTSQEVSKASQSTPSLAPSEKQHFLVRKLQQYTGFTNTYNIVLFSLTAGIFAAFCIFRLPSLDIENVWGKAAAPGEWYWFRQGLRRIGMTVHLWSVLRK